MRSPSQASQRQDATGQGKQGNALIHHWPNNQIYIFFYNAKPQTKHKTRENTNKNQREHNNNPEITRSREKGTPERAMTRYLCNPLSVFSFEAKADHGALCEAAITVVPPGPLRGRDRGGANADKKTGSTIQASKENYTSNTRRKRKLRDKTAHLHYIFSAVSLHHAGVNHITLSVQKNG